jgi:hypothetical protein
MAKFKSDIRSEKSQEEMNQIIIGYLAGKGYSRIEKKQGVQWQKGVYWIKYLKFAFIPGGVSIDAWINVPLAGMGSYFNYFSGKKELQNILKELSRLLGSSATGEGSEWQAMQVPAAGAMPAELDKWNWAAFLWGPVWAIGHNVWIGLLTLVPYVGLVMIFVQGAKGNRWAWEKNRYDSPERYVAKQKKWVQAWFLLLGGIFVFALILPVFLRNR